MYDNMANYLLDGNLEIDNKIENAIRPAAIGRKKIICLQEAMRPHKEPPPSIHLSEYAKSTM
jgi:hypothetical protein